MVADAMQISAREDVREVMVSKMSQKVPSICMNAIPKIEVHSSIKLSSSVWVRKPDQMIDEVSLSETKLLRPILLFSPTR